MNIAQYRLLAQHIATPTFDSAESVVSWMGAMQAQDYQSALWSVGLRSSGLTQTDIEQAIAGRKIIRTWPMRGTLHFIAAKDARWMVKLLAPRATAAAATRRKNLGLNDAVINKSKAILTSALIGGNAITRGDLCALLGKTGIDPSGQRGIHILRYFSELGLLCFGPHQGKQPTFVLMDEWLAPTKELSRDESLAQLTKRYFISHGPATVRDYAGWANITLRDARQGLHFVSNQLRETSIDGNTYWYNPRLEEASLPNAAYLLPGFDEYMLGYKDRSAALHPTHAQKIVPGANGVFLPTVIVDGQVVGTWRKVIRKAGLEIQLTLFQTLSKKDLIAIETAAWRYSAFIQLPTHVKTA